MCVCVCVVEHKRTVCTACNIFTGTSRVCCEIMEGVDHEVLASHFNYKATHILTQKPNRSVLKIIVNVPSLVRAQSIASKHCHGTEGKSMSANAKMRGSLFSVNPSEKFNLLIKKNSKCKKMWIGNYFLRNFKKDSRTHDISRYSSVASLPRGTLPWK